jgi:hypothetical protein
MVAVGNSAFVADGDWLFVQRNGAGDAKAFPPVVSLAAGMGPKGPLVAFGTELGVAFGHAARPLNACLAYSVRDSLHNPVVGVSADGRVVAAADHAALVFRDIHEGGQRIFDFRLPGEPIRQLVATPNPNEIAVFFQSGLVQRYCIGL